MESGDSSVSGADRSVHRRREAQTRTAAHALLAVYIVVWVTAYRGMTPMPVLIVAHWGVAVAILFNVRRVETGRHSGERGWWTWMILLLGVVGVLMWLRHLDHEH